MTDYTKLVKALRRCAEPGTIIDECDTSDDCPYSLDGYGGDCMNNLVKDAAAAIEELEKEKAIANRKLDSALRKIPKCGKWIRIDKHTVQCPLCHRYLDLHGVNAGRGDANYCPNCGAEMEVQE